MVGGGGVVVGGGSGIPVVPGVPAGGWVVTGTAEVAVVAAVVTAGNAAMVSGGASNAALVPHAETATANKAMAVIELALLIVTKLVHPPAYELVDAQEQADCVVGLAGLLQRQHVADAFHDDNAGIGNGGGKRLCGGRFRHDIMFPE